MKRINIIPRDCIPLSSPFITKEEELVIKKVLKSGTLSLGSYLKDFESAVAQFIGTKYAVGVSSGTAGLHLSMVTLNLKPGDEVLTSPFSFVASANVILYVGAKPVFVDIDEKTLNIDTQKIENSITKKTRGILPVHIFGYPIEYKEILKISKKFNLKIIEDACESLGSIYNNKNVGTFGNLSVFAFYPNKQITTGEGGVVVTNNKSEYELLKSLSNQGRSDNGQWLEHDKLGFNYRMDELSAAIGLMQMKKIHYILTSRKKVAQTYKRLLKDISKVATLTDDDKVHKRSWQTFVILLNNGVNRNKVMEYLNAKNIQTKPYLPSIHLQPYWRKAFGFKKGMFPVSESVSERSLALPFYTDMDPSHIAIVCETLEKAIKLKS